LCDIDLPWEADPLREHPNHRNELLNLYTQDLAVSQANFFLISGKAENRLNHALHVIQQEIGLS
jgi:nicotinamide riboside kinase